MTFELRDAKWVISVEFKGEYLALSFVSLQLSYDFRRTSILGCQECAQGKQVKQKNQSNLTSWLTKFLDTGCTTEACQKI